MPNKYEREIEEILRNMERTEPKQGLGQKLGGRMRRKSDSRSNVRRRSNPSLQFGVSEWCLAIAVCASLLAGGWAFAHDGPDIFTGVIAVIGAVCLGIVIILPFMSRSRYSGQSGGSGKVTPIRRNPLSSISTRWNLFMLKIRYRRKRDH
ncbi:MAG TPA: hypothetical protein VEH81_12020 [Ktedonobacteraceae bacterium]|nr:hypothetical protein [Ktedonobacteraceae bacterium]